MPELATSITKCAIGPYRYRGDPQDVVQEVMFSAYQKWRGYDESRSAFKTWVLELTKQYLANLYSTKGVGAGPGLGNRPVPNYGLVSLQQEAEDGSEPLAEVVSDEFTHPEIVIIERERQVQIWTTVHELYLAHRDTRKGQVLEAMAALLDAGLKPTLRNIAALVGCSHTQIAVELEEIRKWLKQR